MNRRKRLGFTLLVLLVVTSGCLELATGDTASFEASEATVSADALDTSEYQLDNKTTENVTHPFEVAGQEREVRVTNHVTQYERSASLDLGSTLSLDVADVGRFVVLSTPAVEIATQTFNPVDDWSEERIVTELSSEYSGLDDVSHVDNRSVHSLGSEQSVARFTGQATIGSGQQVNVELHVTKFRHGDDFIVAIGIHPEMLSSESDRVDTMIGGLEH